MGCWGRGCREKNSRGWYAVVSAPEFDPNPGKNGMGQIWVRTKNHPGAEKLWSGSLLSVLAKNSADCTAITEMKTVAIGNVRQKYKRKPQVTKPGVFGRGGHFRCRLQILQSKSFMRQFLYAKYLPADNDFVLEFHYTHLKYR